jgi:hypothetical protein
MPRTNTHDLYRGMLSPQDPEFAAKVGSLVGYEGPPPYHVDQSVAVHAPAVDGLYGLYADPRVMETSRQQATNRIGWTPQDGKVYGFGDNANQQVWAHEYRHRAGMTDEYTNRLYDAAFAGSEKQWNFAIDGILNILQQQGGDIPPTREQLLGDVYQALAMSFPDQGNWQIWMQKGPDKMLAPDRPKPINKQPVRSTKVKR